MLAHGEIADERHNYETRAAAYYKQRKGLQGINRAQLIGAYQLLLATGDDAAAREHIKAQARALGSTCNARSSLRHHMLDLAFPRAKDSPVRLSDSLRTLYARTLRGAQLKGLNVTQFAEAIAEGGARKAGIKALARFAEGQEKGKSSEAGLPGSKDIDGSGNADQATVGADATVEPEHTFLLDVGPEVDPEGRLAAPRLERGIRYACTFEVIDPSAGRLRVVSLRGPLAHGDQ
jgi:hypothetical protein